jgi:hypothetical protein
METIAHDASSAQMLKGVQYRIRGHGKCDVAEHDEEDPAN